MEKLNIAELIKDCPEGMELDCVMFEKPVKYMGLTNSGTYIKIKTSCDGVFYLTKEGYLHNMADSKCIIFPKGKTTWEGFHRPFEPGDIVITDNDEHAFIYSGENDRFCECYCGVYCGSRNICINSKQWSDKKHKLRLATEEEKEKLFQVIKDNGYKWNPYTKTLEKLIQPKFKVGDKVRHRGNYGVVFTITSIEEDSYVCGAARAFWFDDQDDYELVPNKFDITTLKPFDKVLVRDSDKDMWTATLFSHLRGMTFYIVGGWYNQCIPYEGNQHLLGTTDDCDDFYKTWES